NDQLGLLNDLGRGLAGRDPVDRPLSNVSAEFATENLVVRRLSPLTDPVEVALVPAVQVSFEDLTRESLGHVQFQVSGCGFRSAPPVLRVRSNLAHGRHRRLIPRNALRLESQATVFPRGRLRSL